MMKRTLYFGNPAYLSLTNSQLVIKLPQVEQNRTLPDSMKGEMQKTVPIEDIGVIILDHQQITLTQGLITALVGNNVALISCTENHMPAGLMLSLEGHTLQQEKFRAQLNASLPLKKQLWAQTVESKILNQATVLKQNGGDHEYLVNWSKNISSGDTRNVEAQAAAYYWPRVFKTLPGFIRDRQGMAPNNLLNYGYAIIRAITARSLVASGLLPTMGIHHHNRYNAYCLADDIMEPYRPCIDKLVSSIIASGIDYYEVTTEIKKQLLSVSSMDVLMEGSRSPVYVAVQRTAQSLAKCYEGESRKIVYPEIM